MDLPPAVDEIVIVAARLPEAPGERAFSAIEIGAQTIAAENRLDEALRSAPGVSLFRRNDSAAANPTIQGLSVRASAPSGAGRALVTLEGQPLNDPFGGWVIWGALAPETIARAQVVRGAGAGPYGAGALTGVVELEERAGQGVAFTLEGGELGYRRAAAVGEGGNDRVSLMLAAATEASDGWVPVRAGAGAADVALRTETQGAAARLRWNDGEHAFSARLGGYAEARSAGLVGADSEVSGSSLSLTLARPNGAFGWRLSGWAAQSDLANTSVATAPNRSFTTPANDQFATPASGWGANAAARWTWDQAGLELGADIRAADGETQELFRFVSGQFTRDRVAGGETFLAGAYVETWRQAGPWLLAGGARVDQWRAFNGSRIERDLATLAPVLNFAPADNDAIAPTARIGARRDLGAESFVRAAAYAGFRPPTLNELHRPFRVGNDVTEANAALEPERLVGLDFAIGGEGEVRWNAGVFATRLEDAILNVTLGAGPGTFPPGVFVPAGGAFRQRQNAGAIDAYGLEAEANGAAGAFEWRAALNYAHARMRGGQLDGLRPAQSPEWSLNAGLSWRASDRVTVAADASYESARFEDDQNSRVLAAATVLDLRLDYDISPALTLYAALENAGDAAVETAETADGVESFAAPRALRAGLRLRR